MRLLVVDSVDNIKFFCFLLFVYFVVNFCLSFVCHTHTDIFFTFPPAGPQTKGLVKSLDFPTQFEQFPELLR
jgi:hypothetical protein